MNKKKIHFPFYIISSDLDYHIYGNVCVEYNNPSYDFAFSVLAQHLWNSDQSRVERICGMGHYKVVLSVVKGTFEPIGCFY
jgi:hypothetical protein